jgi:hypothetical protein
MEVIISRVYISTETLGRLYVLNYNTLLRSYEVLFDCCTLELPNKNNAHSVSCIPVGTYNTIKYDRPNGKGKCFWLQDVKDRSAILIHAGNFATGKKVDTEGCILVGSKFSDINADGEADVVESTVTLNKLLDLLPDKFNLTIL